jgi:hypothetical protein
MVMDIIRTCYRRKARIFSDSDREVTIEWFPAPEGAEWFPLPSKFGSRSWHDKADPWPRLGEVQGSPRIYCKKEKSPPYKGKCYVGDDSWWSNGIPYAAALAQQPLPPCCIGALEVGGPVVGGRAVVTSGRGKNLGGLKIGGAASGYFGRRTLEEGGLQLGGAALVVAGRGGMGLLYGGFDPQGKLVADWGPLWQGGLSLGGGPATWETEGDEGDGGLSVGGEADWNNLPDNSRSGGTKIGGAATVQRYDPNSVLTPACTNRIPYDLLATFDNCTGGLAGLAGDVHFVHINGYIWSAGTPNIGNGTVRWQIDFGVYSPSQVPLNCNCLYVSNMVPLQAQCSPLYLQYTGNLPANAMLCGIPKLNGAFRLTIRPAPLS